MSNGRFAGRLWEIREGPAVFSVQERILKFLMPWYSLNTLRTDKNDSLPVLSWRDCQGIRIFLKFFQFTVNTAGPLPDFCIGCEQS